MLDVRLAGLQPCIAFAHVQQMLHQRLARDGGHVTVHCAAAEKLHLTVTCVALNALSMSQPDIFVMVPLLHSTFQKVIMDLAM